MNLNEIRLISAGNLFYSHGVNRCIQMRTREGVNQLFATMFSARTVDERSVHLPPAARRRYFTASWLTPSYYAVAVFPTIRCVLLRRSDPALPGAFPRMLRLTAEHKTPVWIGGGLRPLPDRSFVKSLVKIWTNAHRCNAIAPAAVTSNQLWILRARRCSVAWKPLARDR